MYDEDETTFLDPNVCEELKSHADYIFTETFDDRRENFPRGCGVDVPIDAPLRAFMEAAGICHCIPVVYQFFDECTSARDFPGVNVHIIVPLGASKGRFWLDEDTEILDHDSKILRIPGAIPWMIAPTNSTQYKLFFVEQLDNMPLGTQYHDA